MPEMGGNAPAFALKDQEGKTHKLSDYKGKRLALYFYPKDNTPGCTIQGCNIRDSLGKLNGKGIAVLGISKDSVESHKKFAEEFSFKFPILSDPTGEVVEKYGLWREKTLYGKKFMGIARTTFLIDTKGKIIKVIEKPDVANHADEIIEGFGL